MHLLLYSNSCSRWSYCCQKYASASHQVPERKCTHCYQHSTKIGYIVGRNLLRHASLGLYNHFDTHGTQHHNTILYHCSDILPNPMLLPIPTVCMCVGCVHVCLSEYFPCQCLNNANPSIFSTANKLHYTLCYQVRVCLCTI